MHTLLMVLFGGLVLWFVSLQNTYAALPINELKKRARSDDAESKALYKAASYGVELRGLLWFLIIISSAALFVVLARYTVIWMAYVVNAIVLWIGYVWLPNSPLTRLNRFLGRKCAPFLSMLLSALHPVLSRIVGFLRSQNLDSPHTKIYDRDDLLALLTTQAKQSDSRIWHKELDIAKSALRFGDSKIGDYIIPFRHVKMVKNDDAVGPILMAELHDSGFTHFPVYEGKKHNIVGVLYLRDLVNVRQASTVSTLMKAEVCYLHEQQPLIDALQAIVRTHQQLFIVIDDLEACVGVIGMEDIFTQLLGKPTIDGFDHYQNKSLVATRNNTASEENNGDSTESDPLEAIEVIE
ncbi:MAG: hemolysin family protein [Candidatus Saccharimonadales bacterium]